MKERPIIFSGPMVEAILEGRKTQTRRILKPQPYDDVSPTGRNIIMWQYSKHNATGSTSTETAIKNWKDHCPYGSPGERLWVRETWNGVQLMGGGSLVSYRADRQEPITDDGKWRPSIHMPRWASRITLEVTEVRVERLQEISESDVVAEGVRCPVNAETGHPLLQLTGDKNLPGDYLGKQNRDWLRMDGSEGGSFDEADWLRAHFAALWDNINGTGSWEQNPWVWVVEFRQVEI